MTKLEAQLIKDYIDLAIGDLKEVVIESAKDTKESIDAMNVTLKEHNGRLKKVEVCQEKHNKIIGWATKRWYVLLFVVVGLILLLIPIADVLGLSGLVEAIINNK